MQRRWIDLEGLVNLRDVGGLPTRDGGAVTVGRLLRSDNLQTLTTTDIDRLLELGLTDVVDLRSRFEVDSEGPGPLAGNPSIVIHRHSLFREWSEVAAEVAAASAESGEGDDDLPWPDLTPTVQVDHPVASFYLSYLADRPDSIVASLRDIATARGAALVHCAAGKDRTGTIVALALSLVGVEPEAIVDDYVASSERMVAILDRLLATRTYAASLRDRPLSSHLSYPETMQAFLDYLDSEFGGAEPMLVQMGWTAADSDRLRAKLRG